MIPLEGYFASANPRASTVAGPLAWRAGNDGLAVARFGFANQDTGLVDNSRSNAGQVLGFVFPVVNGNSAVRVWRGIRYARPGVGVSLMANGDYWVRFMGGAQAGDVVWASQVDGTAISGDASNAEPTPWLVVRDIGPGGITVISQVIKVNSNG